MPRVNCRSYYVWAVLFLHFSIHGETFTYQNVTGRETTSTIYTIDKSDGVNKTKVEWLEGKNHSSSEVVMTDSFSTQQWTYSNLKTKTEIQAWLSTDTIFINGMIKSKKISRCFLQKGVVWKQLFPYDLADFALSNSPVYIFCGICILGSAMMEFGTMKAKKIGLEHQTINGIDLELIHLHVTVQGILSKFWHGDYWYEKGSGTLIKSISIDHFLSPPTISVKKSD